MNYIAIRPISSLVLGLAGAGKSSFCLTLTKNGDFIIMNGPRGTRNFRLAHSTIDQCYKKHFKWSLIDTVGILTENYKERNLFLDIQNQFIDEETQIEKLDCVIFVHDSSSRINLEEIRKVLRAVNFIDKNKNVIFVLTKFDHLLDKKDDTRKKTMADYLDSLRPLEIPDIENKIVYWINEDPEEPKFMKRLEKDKNWKLWFETQEEKLINAVQRCESIPMEILKIFYTKIMELCQKTILPNIFKNKDLDKEKVEHFFDVNIYQSDWEHVRKTSMFRLCDFTEEKRKKNRMQEANESFKEQFDHLEKNFKSCIYKYINSHFLRNQMFEVESHEPDILTVDLNEDFCEVIKQELGIDVMIFKQVDNFHESLDFEFLDGKHIKITKKKNYNELVLSYRFGVQFTNMPKIESIIEILLKDKEEEKAKLWEDAIYEFEHPIEQINNDLNMEKAVHFEEFKMETFKKKEEVNNFFFLFY